MQIQFSGKNNLTVTEPLQTHTEEKLQRLQQRFKNIQTVHIVFEVEKTTHTAEATVHIDGMDLHASAKAHDMYVAIDELAKKLMDQLTKHKEKITDHHR